MANDELIIVPTPPESDKPTIRARRVEREEPREPHEPPANKSCLVILVFYSFIATGLGLILFFTTMYFQYKYRDAERNAQNGSFDFKASTQARKPMETSIATGNLIRKTFEATRTESPKAFPEVESWFLTMLRDVKNRNAQTSIASHQELTAQARNICDSIDPQHSLSNHQEKMACNNVIDYSMADWRNYDLDRTAISLIAHDANLNIYRIIARHPHRQTKRIEVVAWYVKANPMEIVEWESITYGETLSLVVAFECLKADSEIPWIEQYGQLIAMRVNLLSNIYQENSYYLRNQLNPVGLANPQGDFAFLMQLYHMKMILQDKESSQISKVIEHYQKIEPKNLTLMLRDVETLAHLQQTDEAIAKGELLLKSVGPMPELLTALGDAHMAKDRPKTATKLYTEVLNLDPGYTRALLGLVKSDQTPERQTLLAAIAKYPRVESLSYQLSNALQGDTQEQREARLLIFEKLHAKWPADTNYHTSYLKALLENQRINEFKLELTKSLPNYNDDERETLFRDLCYQVGYANEATKFHGLRPNLYELILPFTTAKSEAFSILCNQVAFQFEENRYRNTKKLHEAKAVQEFEKLIDLQQKKWPDDIVLAYAQARLAYYRKDFAKTETLLSKIKSLPRFGRRDRDDEDDPDWDLNQLRWKVALKMSKAKTVVSAMLEKKDNDNLKQFFMVADEIKMRDAALPLIEMYEKQYPKEKQIYEWRASAYRHMGQLTDAITQQRKYVDELKKDTQSQYLLTRAKEELARDMIKAGKAKEALKYIRDEAVDVTLEVFALAKSNDHASAIARMNDAIRSGDREVDLFYNNEDLEEILKGPEYKAFREKNPKSEAEEKE